MIHLHMHRDRFVRPRHSDRQPEHSLRSLGVALLDLCVSALVHSTKHPLTSDSLAFLTPFESDFLLVFTRLAGLSGKSASPPLTSFCSALNPFDPPVAEL